MGWCLQICTHNGEKNYPKSLLSLPPVNDDLCCCDAAGNISKLKVSHQWWNDLFFLLENMQAISLYAKELMGGRHKRMEGEGVISF